MAIAATSTINPNKTSNHYALTAMAGAVGAGGLGNYAIMYGHDRNQLDVTWVTIVVLVVVVNLIQLLGNKIIKKNRH